MTLLEVCVADALSLAEAIAGGADRIELCSSLELGGLTPTPGLIGQAAEAPIPIYAMVRPRSGDFVFDTGDLDCMYREIDAVRAAGLAGVVLGASRPDGTLDTAMLEKLSRHASGLGTTLHRAIDLAGLSTVERCHACTCIRKSYRGGGGNSRAARSRTASSTATPSVAARRVA